jgi:rsbT antagonist protein RsbS
VAGKRAVNAGLRSGGRGSDRRRDAPVPKATSAGLNRGSSQAVVSILRHGGLLVACLHAGLDDGQFIRFRRDLVDEVDFSATRGLLVDLLAVDVLDSFACLVLRQIVEMAGARGAATVLVGIHPDVACTIKRLGADLVGARIAADLDQGVLLFGSTSRHSSITANLFDGGLLATCGCTMVRRPMDGYLEGAALAQRTSVDHDGHRYVRNRQKYREIRAARRGHHPGR